MKSSRIIKVVATICFALIALSLIVLRNSPATGYEASIYTATPPLVWIVLILSIICGAGIIFHQVYTGRENKSNLWVTGLVLIAFSVVILMAMPFIKSYFFYGGTDPLYHLKTIRELVASGHVKSGNLYPVYHISIAQLSQISNSEPQVLMKYLPIPVNVLFVVFMYFFARSVLPRKGQAILAAMAGTSMLLLPAHGLPHTTPNQMANSLIPMALFLCIRSLSKDAQQVKTQFRILLIIVIFYFPLLHLLPSFNFLLTMMTMWLPITWLLIRTYSFIGRKKVGVPNRLGHEYFPVESLLLFVWIILWFSSFTVFTQSIRIAYYTIIGQGGTSFFASYAGEAAKGSALGYNALEQFFKRYGNLLVYTVISAISVPVLVRKISNTRDLDRLSSFYGPLLLSGGAMVFFFVSSLPYFGPGRFSNYLVMMCSLFVGFVLYELLEQARSAKSRGLLLKASFSLLALLQVLILLNGMFTLYNSRYILSPSNQITLTQMKGVEWFVNSKDNQNSSLFWSIAPWRFAAFLATPEEINERLDIYSSSYYEHIPRRFNYDTLNMLGESYTEDRYMIVAQPLRVVYSEIYPEIAKFNVIPTDFDRLENDLSVDKLYSNSGLDVYYVHPVGP